MIVLLNVSLFVILITMFVLYTREIWDFIICFVYVLCLFYLYCVFVLHLSYADDVDAFYCFDML